MSAVDREPFPKIALIAAATLIGFTIIVTAAGRMARVNAPPVAAMTASAAPAQSLNLHFTDEADGSVTIRESGSGRQVATLEPGTNGFIRGVLRGLVRERRGLKIGAEPPFRLAAWPDGQLALDDTATGRRIDLNAFGTSNEQAFRKLLSPQDPRS